MFHIELKLQPSEMLASWRPETVRLLLPTPQAPQLRQRAAVRIHVGKPPVTATVLGTVVSVHRKEGQHGIEFAPDADNLSAVRLLLSAARGEPVLYLDRPQRWLARLPVVVASTAGAIYMTTFSVSDRGCGLTWSGPLPTMGQGLQLRFGAGPRAVDVRAVVCWSTPRGGAATAGVQFANGRGAPPAWGGILAEVARSGAPRA